MSDARTGSQVLTAAVQQLTKAGVPDAARDARKLFAYASGVDAGRLTLILPEPVSAEVMTRFDHLIARRARFEPVSHLIGSRAFYGRDFEVTKDVLDPRPETETLIDVALRDPFARVLDLGTGSGCILVTLLAENTQAVGVGADVSPKALAVALRNAQRHHVDDRATFVQSDWLAGIRRPFDLIVANPPYIAADEMAGLSRDVREWEPRLALTDEADGLFAYRTIISQAQDVLEPDGRLIFEIGSTQGKAVAELMLQGGLTHVFVIPDLDGRDRVVTGKTRRS
ncbi:[protein release factor]-glutamine N5-methyltransferase [Loktanella sp. PT4BL]|uniref:peptide chain release factor N(5)-glutamine methyltransferase n=1 Tax=Loktanella sp. PT4BL TaxID=2135611 RepID=UPI000D759E61|nr:peptide chain release factor N(5)-glutamine methyltransferase [Loktanella sp. PT4BL]PXW70200.1 [protein release factor]-glutamine N5-methyltransferase [Loktanella sp. PT4BL]